MAFELKKFNENDHIPKEYTKIAEFVIDNPEEGNPFIQRHLKKGIYIKETDTKSDKNKIINIDSTTYILSPYLKLEKNQVHRIAVFGMSGSGKSTYIARHIIDQLCEDNSILVYIFTTNTHDPEYDRPHSSHNIKPHRINLKDPTLFMLECEYFKNSLLIFDDIERITDKPTLNFVLQFRNQCLENSRKYNTHIVSVSHDMLSAGLNKVVKSEMTACVLYPKYNQYHQTSVFLKTYLGLDDTKIKEISKLKSRWVYIKRNVPQYMVHQHGCEILI